MESTSDELRDVRQTCSGFCNISFHPRYPDNKKHSDNLNKKNNPCLLAELSAKKFIIYWKHPSEPATIWNTTHIETSKDNAARSMNSAATPHQPPTKANLARHRYQEKLVSCTKLCPAAPQTRTSPRPGTSPAAAQRLPFVPSPAPAARPAGSAREPQRRRAEPSRAEPSPAEPSPAAHLLLAAPGASRAPSGGRDSLALDPRLRSQLRLASC